MALARCRRLQVLVGNGQVRVPKVVANRELMFAHLDQQCSYRMPESMPTDTGDTESGERRFDLPVENRRKIHGIFPLVNVRREEKILRPVVMAL